MDVLSAQKFAVIEQTFGESALRLSRQASNVHHLSFEKISQYASRRNSHSSNSRRPIVRAKPHGGYLEPSHRPPNLLVLDFPHTLGRSLNQTPSDNRQHGAIHNQA